MGKVRRAKNPSPFRFALRKEVAVGVFVLVAGGLFLWGRYSGKKKDDKAGPEGVAVAAYAFATPAHGPASAPVVLAKWTDFQ